MDNGMIIVYSIVIFAAIGAGVLVVNWYRRRKK